MKIKCLYVVLALFNASALLSQSKIYTYIQRDKKSYAGRAWCLERVVDRRIDKSNIGHIFTRGLGIEHPADFKQELSGELIHFFNDNFFCLRAKNRFMLVVNRFEIGHIVTTKRLDTGEVFFDFDFYALKNDSAFFLYNYAKRLTEASDVVPTTHPNRLRRALLNSLLPLDNFFSIRVNDTLRNKSAVFYNASQSDSVKKNNYGLTVTKSKQLDSTYSANNLPSYYFFFIGGQGNICYTSLTTHVNANLLFQLKKHPKYLIGVQANYFLYGILSQKLISSYATYSLFNYDIGIRVLKQIKGNLFINFNPQAMFGRETFTYFVLPAGSITGQLNQTYPINGVQVDIGVYNFEPQKQGIYFGADVFFRGSNSNMLENTIGLKLSVGIKF